MKHKEAEKICDRVAKDIKKWIKDKRVVTSDQISKKASSCIRKHSKKAAFIYETHRKVS
tara:strand:+ start:7909 stop:8085 length:177 start_codon:yes stop_codon:yes gene_type:complete